VAKQPIHARGCISYIETIFLSCLFRHFTSTRISPNNTISNISKMLSTIKTSLCSVLLLATYATAATQSAINLEVKYCSKENTGASNDQGTSLLERFRLEYLSLANVISQVPTSTNLWALATTFARANSPTQFSSTRNATARTTSRPRRSAWRAVTRDALATLTRSAATRVPVCSPTLLSMALPSLAARQHLRSVYSCFARAHPYGTSY
jgi:hypothetical protein